MPRTAPNRSEFVRSMPDATVPEVVAAAAKLGLNVKAGLVYAVRAVERRKPAKQRRKPGPKPRAARHADDVEQRIVALVVEHGLATVEASVRSARQRVRELAASVTL